MDATAGELDRRVQVLLEEERFRELREAFSFAITRVGIPLHLACWILDLIYIPEHKWLFLFARVALAPVAVFFSRKLFNAKTYLLAQLMAVGFLGVAALTIVIMIYFIGDVASHYYAGLNIVFLAVSIFPTSKLVFAASFLVVYGPFLILSGIQYGSEGLKEEFGYQLAFILCTTVCMYAARKFHALTMYREVKQRVLLQQEMDRRKKAESALNELSNQVVHDIRAPVAALNVLLGQSDSNSLEWKNVLQRVTARIAGIISDLENMSSCRVNDFEPTYRSESRSVSISRIGELLGHLVKEKEAHHRDRRVNLHYLDSTAVTFGSRVINTSDNEVLRVVSNLIENSVRAIKVGGAIHLRLQMLGLQFCVQVIDDGCGMDSELLDSVRRSRPSNGDKSTNGLGLSYALRVVQGAGGVVNVSSSLGNGCKVELIFPTHEI